MSYSLVQNACDAAGQLAREYRLGLLDAEDERLDGRLLEIEGRSLLQFCSCSYLGLELDARLIEGAVEATRRFGTQFSMSRTFVSAPPYAELEGLLGELTGGACLVLPSTSLATATALPALVQPGDRVLFDQQVHMSVQAVLPQLVAIGCRIARISHLGFDELEEALADSSDSGERVWLLIDGVFSMYGDCAPMARLAWLLERHPRLHLYIDDAHGTSWTGRHGRGHALEALGARDRVVVALSLNKAFATGGGALVFHDAALRDRVRHVGGPTNFGGPLPPPMLGAAIASARVHLSEAFPALQLELRQRIDHVNRRARALGLPLVEPDAPSPIRFIGLGSQEAAIALALWLRERGLLVSCALFPAVPQDRCGLRFTITRHHTIADLDRLLETLAEGLPGALAAGDITRETIDLAFGLKRDETAPA